MLWTTASNSALILARARRARQVSSSWERLEAARAVCAAFKPLGARDGPLVKDALARDACALVAAPEGLGQMEPFKRAEWDAATGALALALDPFEVEAFKILQVQQQVF